MWRNKPSYPFDAGDLANLSLSLLALIALLLLIGRLFRRDFRSRRGRFLFVSLFLGATFLMPYFSHAAVVVNHGVDEVEPVLTAIQAALFVFSLLLLVFAFAGVTRIEPPARAGKPMLAVEPRSEGSEEFVESSPRAPVPHPPFPPVRIPAPPPPRA